MGVIVSASTFGALEGAAREEAFVLIVSYECFADRGLGSLPGGDESELVKGVSACRDMAGPERDIVVGGRERKAARVDAVQLSVQAPRIVDISMPWICLFCG